MKRAASEENVTCDDDYARKCNKTEETEEDILINTRYTYIVTDYKLKTTNVVLRVQVTNDNILCTDIGLVVGDPNLFAMAKKDILKFLLKTHNKLVKGEQYVVYVNN
ncbi:hypothetical protein [Erinnyis ello granulovirus]|uniref:Uncharacterized protein n=1 Tax=Erinnyis ello granulovirus TaxID=307444 RepID=A0A097DAR0_9BBAC|nr:hypothetical protein [Erinnyis ello granulovirus]AIS92068.1 hypothetical protein [Erinnyis ello granulovirus]ARX71408.1 hypothetical protein EREL_069 [Erinnyis ello granulovirus]ARX71538.1 hypothetical protein EREL_069 [Erinnyis ello granulovirus]ARX71668.1 hypothetical protein EREL_069 [Erinnyis ello granulovirus]ARX71798.1 hypothetical protein EREL_069 [Erinnyis ello granulovirus]